MRRRAILAGVVAGAAIVAVDVLRLRAGVSTGNIVPAWTFYAAVWFIGRTIRQRRLQAERLQDLAAQLELEREEKARTAVIEERSRISRELHDQFGQMLTAMGSMLGRAEKHAPPDSPLRSDLREIGERKGRLVEVTKRIRALREAHAKKPSFLARLSKAGF